MPPDHHQTIGLDANDTNALQAAFDTAFDTAIGFADAQHMFDLNADGAIDALDLVQLVTHSGFANSTLGDFDLDGDTDSDDLSILRTGYGTTSGALFTQGDLDA